MTPVPPGPSTQPPSETRCEFCTYFQPGAFGLLGSDDYGACRRNPPQVAPIMSSPEHISREDMLRSRWPSVKPTDWCGEFYRLRP